jgi:hypothetical protein
MAVEVVALDAQRSFLHMSYSYAYGLAARLAMQSYLATAGRNRVGFTIVGRQADGQPIHVGGMRAGGVRRIVVPADQGYGLIGRPADVPANSPVVFEIRLLSVRD